MFLTWKNVNPLYIILFILRTSMAVFSDNMGGGRLVDPLGRSSLWRLNESSFPINIQDHRVNCGGFEAQWLKQNGECGVCGDPVDQSRDHENGGKFHSNFISQTYLQNEIINVTVETMSDMYGYFEFRLCPYKNKETVTKECLNKNILEIGDTGYTRYKVWNSGYHVIPLKLPADMTCDNCLLQFKYHTGKIWGCDGDSCCHGCSPIQEEFYSCADIRILTDTTIKYNAEERSKVHSVSSPYMAWWCIFQCVEDECFTPQCAKQTHLRLKRQTTICKATGIWAGRSAMDNWCSKNCLSQRPYCPASHCKCETDNGNPVVTTTTTTQATTTPSKLTATISPTESTATLGDDSIQIRCDVTGSPSAVTWYWIKIPITVGFSSIIYQGTNSDKYMVENSSSGPHLTIKNIQKEDAADYMCVVVSTVESALSLKSRLNVQGDLLTVTVQANNFTVNIGASSIQLLCTVTGVPTATDWFWRKTEVGDGPSTKIDKGTNNDKYTVDNSATNPILTIKNITGDDEAFYTCYAINSVGTSYSTRVRLTVESGSAPNIVRVMASAGCEYCDDKNNLTCSSWYCPEEYTADLGLAGTLTTKVNQMADDFCSSCSSNDTACQDLFCLPNRHMVSLAIQARCNLCSLPGIQCPADPECNSTTGTSQFDEPTTQPPLDCKAGGSWVGFAAVDEWCKDSCPTNCPTDYCQCSGVETIQTQQINSLTCTGAGAWAYSEAMGTWCNLNCPSVCPSTHCSCTEPTTVQPTTQQTTTTSPTKVPLDTDLYSANAMNGVMCSICQRNSSYTGCSNKYCQLFNPDLEEPGDSFSRVFTFSPAIFCQLAAKEENTSLKSLFLQLNDGRLTADTFYRNIDTHQYLNFTSWHLTHTKRYIPYCLARKIRTIVEDTNIKEERLDELKHFFRKQKYPLTLIVNGIERTKQIQIKTLRATRNDDASNNEVTTKDGTKISKMTTRTVKAKT